MFKYVRRIVAAIVACCAPIALYYSRSYVERRKARKQLYRELSRLLSVFADFRSAVSIAQNGTEDNVQECLSKSKAARRAKEDISRLFDELKPCLSRGDERIVDRALRVANSFLGIVRRCSEEERRSERGYHESLRETPN